MSRKSEPPQLIKTITRSVLGLIFITVVSLSLLLSPDLAWEDIAMAFLKGMLALGFGWIFFLILSDTIVKTIASSLREGVNYQETPLLRHFPHSLKSNESDLEPVASKGDLSGKSRK